MAKLWNPVVIDFTTTIAAGATGQTTTKIDSASPFICQALSIVLFTPTGTTYLTSTIAGTPYVMPDSSSSPGTTGNTLATLAHFRLQINTGSNDWFTAPARVPLVCGDGRLPGFFGVPRIIGVGYDVRATIYNDVAATFGVQGQLILHGFREVADGTVGSVK